MCVSICWFHQHIDSAQ